jgi:hypothetical protein
MSKIPIPQEDARLKEAMSEIIEVLDRYGIGGTILLSSSTHAEYCAHLPEWSVIQKEGEAGYRVKISAKRDSIELVQASAHLIYSQRDMNGLMFQAYSGLCEHLAKLLEIESVPFGGIPEMDGWEAPDLKPAPAKAIDFLRQRKSKKKPKGFL